MNFVSQLSQFIVNAYIRKYGLNAGKKIEIPRELVDSTRKSIRRSPSEIYTLNCYVRDGGLYKRVKFPRLMTK